MPEELTEPLRQLAAAHGVTTEYWDWGGERRQVSRESLVAILAALDVRAGTDAEVEASSLAAADAPWRAMLPPTVIARQGQWTHVPVHVDHGDPVKVWIELEDDPAVGATGGLVDAPQADVWVEPRSVDGRLIGRATFALPADLPLGWHTLHAASPRVEASATLVVTPGALSLPATLESRRGWGTMAQLYSIRSARSWGIGDFADLADLAWLTGRELGADFVLVNPLLAAEPSPPLTPSPYLPSSRLFINPMYIRPEAIEEAAYLTDSGARALREGQASVAALNDEADLLDRDASWAAKKPVLERLFAAPRSTARDSSLAAFRAEGGDELAGFAQWCALTEHFGDPAWSAGPGHGRTDPAIVALLATPEIARRVEFHIWLQWVADAQLGHAQQVARESGMRIGVMSDLPVGVHEHGADVWALGKSLASGIYAGAPPDMFNDLGQSWTQPPWRPDVLAATGYAAYRRMLQGAVRHAGAVRIDHIIGLFRLWWIPAGKPASSGAYVRYDHEAMVGILLLEAQRAGALVIGEDLGLVEPWVRDYLAARGVLGTSVLWFEHEDDGSPRAPERYRRLALATVTTHDLPPTAGYLAGEHVELRKRLGLLTEPVSVARAAAARERDAMVGLLRDRGLLPARSPGEGELVGALHRLLRSSPSVLLGVSLADAVGERRAQNQPGTDREYPNWSIPLADGSGAAVDLDALLASPRLRDVL